MCGNCSLFGRLEYSRGELGEEPSWKEMGIIVEPCFDMMRPKIHLFTGELYNSGVNAAEYGFLLRH